MGTEREPGSPSSEARRRSTMIRRDGVSLAALLLVPGGRGPFPCVVFVHGLDSSKESPRNTVIAERLLDAGLGVVLFDLSGHGESSRDPRDGDDAYVDDLVAAFRWALEQQEVDPARSGVAGSSLGGTIAASAVSRGLVRPAAMVLRAPPVGLRDLESLPVPTLVLVGSADQLLLSVQAAAERSRLAQLSVVPGASHLFEEPGTLEEAVERTVSWFVARLTASEEHEAV